MSGRLYFTCLCGETFDNLDDFWSHRREEHDDYPFFDTAHKHEEDTAPPCITCGTVYGKKGAGRVLPYRSKLGRCRMCFDVWRSLTNDAKEE